jgi:hypothetical protein
MPTQEITTQVSSAHAKQLVANVVSAFQSVRDAQSAVQDAQEDALFARYEWGREVHNALDAAEKGDAVAEEVGRRIDRSAAWVRQHARFANTVTETFPNFNPPIAGYVADCLDTDRSLAWRSAVSWMSHTGTADEGDQTATEWERMRRDVERKLEALEETAEKAAEAVLDEGDTMNAEERRAMEGVLTRAQQAIEDNKHLADDLEDEAPGRIECEPYRRWLAKSGVCDACGVMDETIVAHHPEHVYPDRGGTATKINDFLCVRLCHDCHQRVEGAEETDERAFWEDIGKDPRVIAAQHQARWNAKLITK